jgi:hypothetical protein
LSRKEGKIDSVSVYIYKRYHRELRQSLPRFIGECAGFLPVVARPVLRRAGSFFVSLCEMRWQASGVTNECVCLQCLLDYLPTVARAGVMAGRRLKRHCGRRPNIKIPMLSPFRDNQIKMYVCLLNCPVKKEILS